MANMVGSPSLHLDLDMALAVFMDGVEERGPTVREFTRGIGLSAASNGLEWMRRLERAGYVERDEHGHYKPTLKGRFRNNAWADEVMRR